MSGKTFHNLSINISARKMSKYSKNMFMLVQVRFLCQMSFGTKLIIKIKVAAVLYSIHFRIEDKCLCTSTKLFWGRCEIITFLSLSLLSALSLYLRNSRISVKVSCFFTELCIQNDRSFNFS